ncbi:MAG: DUF4159 domain-containing protein [Nostocaceae cyanobacterium CSU_2_110]|nr:DUF4159 domain-containing protein [Nostocaceae cyanobacterium CSU_2_110]
MGDLVRVLTANSGSESQFGLGGGSTGAAQFNLRGRWTIDYPDSDENFSWRLSQLTTIKVSYGQKCHRMILISH